MADKAFHLKDCTLIEIAMGIKAQMLNELRDHLATVEAASIYFHFWGGRLRTEFEHVDYHNDFSYWANRYLHDDILAERLAVLNPSDYHSLELLRTEIIDIIDERLYELDFIPGSKRDQAFHFLKSNILVFNLPVKIESPHQLTEYIPKMSRSSLFYHFIDARRRTEDGTDDFSNWLASFGDEYRLLIKQIAKIDAYLISLTDIKNRLYLIFQDYFKGTEHQDE